MCPFVPRKLKKIIKNWKLRYGLLYLKILFKWNQSRIWYNVFSVATSVHCNGLVGLVVLRIYVALAVFQPYRDLEAGDNQSQVARPGIEPRTLIRKSRA